MKPDWYLALTFSERLAALKNAPRQAKTGGNSAALRKLELWQANAQLPDAEALRKCFAAQEADEAAVLHLLEDSPEELRQRHDPPPPWLTKLDRVLDREAAPGEMWILEEADRASPIGFLNLVHPYLLEGAAALHAHVAMLFPDDKRVDPKEPRVRRCAP